MPKYNVTFSHANGRHVGTLDVHDAMMISFLRDGANMSISSITHPDDKQIIGLTMDLITYASDQSDCDVNENPAKEDSREPNLVEVWQSMTPAQQDLANFMVWKVREGKE